MRLPTNVNDTDLTTGPTARAFPTSIPRTSLTPACMQAHATSAQQGCRQITDGDRALCVNEEAYRSSGAGSDNGGQGPRMTAVEPHAISTMNWWFTPAAGQSSAGTVAVSASAASASASASASAMQRHDSTAAVQTFAQLPIPLPTINPPPPLSDGSSSTEGEAKLRAGRA